LIQKITQSSAFATRVLDSPEISVFFVVPGRIALARYETRPTTDPLIRLIR
jgi:hypothetical protein